MSRRQTHNTAPQAQPRSALRNIDWPYVYVAAVVSAVYATLAVVAGYLVHSAF